MLDKSKQLSKTILLCHSVSCWSFSTAMLEPLAKGTPSIECTQLTAHNVTGSASSSPRVIDFQSAAKNTIIPIIKRALLTRRGLEASSKHSEVRLHLARFGQPGGIKAVFLHGHDLHGQVLLTPFISNFKKILRASSATLGTEWAMLTSFSC